jgi:alginate O-acetyltransferase complex protein AlgI
MLFNSSPFIGLVILTMLVYYIPRFSKYQIHILIASSLIFYSWSNISLVLLLLISAGINVLASYFIGTKQTNKPKLIAWIGVSLNLSILVFFKYAGIISLTFFKNDSISDFLVTIPLPIGISFFTFQGVSLVVDVYKENHFKNNEIISKSLIEHAKKILFFISFFPQLVAGPIVKAHEFLPQIGRKLFTEIQWEKCFREIVQGYFLKMVIADNLKEFTFWISYPHFQMQDTYSLITMLFGYSFQIYSDFAGYSLIAIGVARLFGYNLKANFNFPYIASSFKEFWERWHISLSSFLKEYLYIPLGGNRKGNGRSYINLMITMILGGLWHGAAWSFAVWGGFHGLALVIERFFTNRKRRKENLFIQTIKTILVFLMVTLGWLLFKLPEFNHVIEYLKSVVQNNNNQVNIGLLLSILIYSSPVILHHMYILYTTHFESGVIHRFKFVVYSIMIFLIITNSGISGSFIYFQF